MAAKRHNLIKKAFAICQSIETMSPDERQRMPTKIFGDDYNNLQKMAVEAVAEKSSLVKALPPQVNIEEYGTGHEFFSTQTYSEIHAFCRQISALL